MTTTYSPITAAARAALAAIEAQRFDDPALVEHDLAATKQQAEELLHQIPALNSRVDAQQLANAETRQRAEDARREQKALLAEAAISIDEATTRRVAAAAKKIVPIVNETAESLATGELLLDALKSKLAAVEAERIEVLGRLAPLLDAHTARFGRILGDEFRAFARAMGPLLQFASAIGTGARAHGVYIALRDITVPAPDSTTPALSGTKAADHDHMIQAGTLSLPSQVDLAADWASDQTLAALAAALQAPMDVHRRLKAYRTRAEREAEDRREAAEEARRAAYRPTGSVTQQASATTATQPPAAQKAQAAKPVDGEMGHQLLDLAMESSDPFAATFNTPAVQQ